MPPLPVYRGEFGLPQAERLLWRAGFGPRPGEVERVAGLGLERAVLELTRPGPEKLVGPAPHDRKGRPLAPLDAWGHDHAWWLDRMVRTSRPLVERMTLVWHDWFATSDDGVGSHKLMLNQNALLRRHALGSFSELLLEITRDPAMLLWLSGTDNEREAPNENYARELMELFTLGAGRGYREQDVREQARALSGFTNDWQRGVGPVNFHYERRRHDPGTKRIFGHAGTFDWRDACMLCLGNDRHPSFFVRKLWSYFVPTPPAASTQRALEQLYVGGKRELRPVLEAILLHPDLHEGPRMVKPPVVYTAGQLRALGRGVDGEDWAWIHSLCGQKLFEPPSVAGWDENRWLDTATFRGRWIATARATDGYELDPRKPRSPRDPDQLLERALAFWGKPSLTDGTRAGLVSFARRTLAESRGWQQQVYPVMVENALRQLVAMSPDLQTC